eukprot:jgi/Mesvir1/17689/Mv07869-RA.1
MLHITANASCLRALPPVLRRLLLASSPPNDPHPSIPGSDVVKDGLSDEEDEEDVASMACSSEQGDRLEVSQLVQGDTEEGGEEEVFPSFHKPTDHEKWMGRVHVDTNFEARRLADQNTTRTDPEDPYRGCDDEDMRNIRAGIFNYKVDYKKLAAWEAKHGPYVWPPKIEYRDDRGFSRVKK